MKHYSISISAKHRANLEKLARYLLKTYRENKQYLSFDMLHFAESSRIHGCGTVCCAAGHGPLAGIGRIKNPLRVKDWNNYITKYFGTFCVYYGYDLIYDWCFDARWVSVDNTPRGAAKRILYMLKYGVPYDHFRQQEGASSLCYTRVKLS